MFLDPSKTVRELAAAFPKVTRVFEQTKIDYCRGGNQLLGDACARAGLDLRVLTQMLETSIPAAVSAFDFRQLTLAESIKYILDTHHLYARDEIRRLEGLVEKVCAAHGANHSELLSMRDLLRQLFVELKDHMFKEEQILFPFLLQMEAAALKNGQVPFAPFGTVNNPIRMMVLEHDTTGELLRELRKLSGGYHLPDDAGISYKIFYEALEAFEQNLHQHIHLENNVLFPRAVAMEARL